MIFDTKILAFLSLLIVQVLVSIVYKFSQTKGTYAYSPLSAIASAEFIKLCISSTLLLYSVPIDEITTTFSFNSMIYNRLSACYMLFQKEVTRMFVAYTFVLALLYVINNQLAFVLFLNVDIASISMFKSFSTVISAILLWTFFQRNITREQWCSIILQVTGLCIVQYDSCKDRPFLAFKDYVILIGSTFITAVCSVWNERLLKTYSVHIYIQNSILYSFGLIINLILFIFFPNLFGQQDSTKHFFDGYSFLVFGIILCNSLLGIVITFVYKYADVIVKTFSTACATGVLLYINVAVFKLKANVTVFLGAIVIFVASYLFLLVKSTVSIVPVNLNGDIDTTENEKNKSNWRQNFRWKCCLMSLISVSVVFYLSISLLGNGEFFRSINKFYLINTTSLSPNIIRIEEIRYNRSIVIHGVNLCTNETLNATRISINSIECFPIMICSNTVLSCYLQNILNNQSLSATVNINLTTSVQGLSTRTTINTKIPCTSFLTYWQKNDVVLVVHFNRPHYERIPTLTIYRELFPLVLFTGPKPDPNIIECPEGALGLRAYQCLSRVISLHPNHTGYLMAHFDVLPIFYNLEGRSLTSIWIAPIRCFNQTEGTGWVWWDYHTGLPARSKVFNELGVNGENTTYDGRYAANYRNHTGKKSLCFSFADIYYLPQRFIFDWLLLTELFNRHNVFHEIAFSTMTYMMISGNLSHSLEILMGEEYTGKYSLVTLANNEQLEFIHRIEHELPDQKYLIEAIVLRSLFRTGV